MNADEFTERLPPLTNNPLPIKPPFVFNGMSARIFPLRASLDALQQLCNGYLNFVPPEAGRFRASMPYIFLMVLDYGEVAEAITRIGWFAQMEVFFSVPVDWYRLVNGKWVFQDFAVITPYIFVDDSFSVPLGRTVYGFPKILADITSTPSMWVKDPLAPVTCARVETAVFPEAYAGKRLEKRLFLEVERQAPMSNLRVPFDPSSPVMPWVAASNLTQALAGLGRDAMWMAQAMRIFPVNPGHNPAFLSLLPEMLTRLGAAMAPGGSGFVQNSLNLKQFRRADDPSRICYQALTNGQMITTGVNGGGLLGEERTILGDVSGGYSIKLHEHSSLPIARTLGLEVQRRSPSEDGGVAELKPVMPFWINVDLRYEQGTNLAWRTQDGIWRNEGGQSFAATKAQSEANREPAFNSAVASAVEAVAGPFQFSGTTIRVLPLLAYKKKLETFLDEYVNKALDAPIGSEPLESDSIIVHEDGTVANKVRLSVWARPAGRVNEGFEIGGDFAYVYLTASSFSEVVSKTNNVGDWAKYELSFLIPVKFERLTDAGTWEVQGVGVVPAVTLVDDCVAAISRFEIQGFDARTASFVRPESVWLKEGEASVDPKQTLLRVDAEVWTAYGTGQKAAMQPLIDISSRDVTLGLGDADEGAERSDWSWILRLEHGLKVGTKARFPVACKHARALALELLGNRTPFALYTLKQFRDVHDPDKACYQELVRVPRVLSEVLDIQEIEETLIVRIQDFPSLKLVETLGIVAPAIPESGAGIVYAAQAARSFYIRATVDEPLAERLLSRAGGKHWSLSSDAFKTLLSDEEGAPAIAADGRAEALMDRSDPCEMSSLMLDASGREGRGFGAEPADKNAYPDWLSHGRKMFDKAAARRAIRVVDPQMVIDSVLSREWGNADPNARWRRGRRHLLAAFSTLPMSGPNKAFAESVMFRQANNAMAALPGGVASLLDPRPPDRAKSHAEPDFDPAAPSAEPMMRQREARLDVTWRAPLLNMLDDQQLYTGTLLRMEELFNVVSAFAVLDSQGLELPQKRLKPPTVADLAKLKSLVDTIRGLPRQEAKFDLRVEAAKFRLDELLPQDEFWKTPRRIRDNFDYFREVVKLARTISAAHREALVDKLARAYQKPDFCIKRDSAGPDRDRLYPAALSWDADWYYGRAIPEEQVTRFDPRYGGEPDPWPEKDAIDALPMEKTR